MYRKTLACLSCLTLGLGSQLLHASELLELNDIELAEIQGQALLTLSQTNGTSPVDNNPVRFFKLGAEAVIDINANIKKLQLGCGGANGAGNCDIDIDNIALSGLPRNADGSIKTDYTAQDRAGSSAKITNPFIQFAIKNPDNLSTREMVGFRLSAEAIQGLMTLGTENSSTPNGINSFSGYIRNKTSTGTAFTQARNMTYQDVEGANPNISGDGIIRGAVVGTLLGAPVTLNYRSTNFNFALESTRAPFTIPAQDIFGSRITANTVVLKGSGTVDPINFSGPLTANIDQLLGFPLTKQTTGRITDLKTDITITQKLGLIHSLYLQNPASLSLQKERVLYPNATKVAERGWWLAIEDELELGDISPQDPVPISNQVLLQTVKPISDYLTNNPTPCGSLLGGCTFGGNLAVGDIKLTQTVLDFPLVDLVLKGQNFRQNCYGNLKFC